MKRTTLVAGTAALALTLAACGNDSDDTRAQTASTTLLAAGSDTTQAEFNASDVAFARSMIPHHRQAVEMAEQVLDRGNDPRVIDLATRITNAQDPEIMTMESWLTDWRQPLPDDTASGDMDHDSMDGTGGMMTDTEMENLAEATGAELDVIFVEMMIQHHSGAIDMAATELADGRNTEALALAEAIIDAQQAEITEMEQLLPQLEG